MKVTATLIDGTIHADADLIDSVLSVEADLINPIRVSQYADYTGEYEITSFCADPLLTTSLILPTADKHMLDDVTVYSVPTREEENAAGGVTFIIGS